MKILCIGYRDWSIEIYERLKKENKKHSFKIIKSTDNSYISNIQKFNPELILFYGWSNKIDKEIVSQYKCLMLHPSPLPKYYQLALNQQARLLVSALTKSSE